MQGAWVAQTAKPITIRLADHMVYAVAKECDEPPQCDGIGFAATDVELHATNKSE
jgi:hypothetical protein